MARIQAYKFVNPGVSNVASPKVHAAAKHTLAVNRIGSTVEGIGHVVTDLVAINKATLAFQKRVERTKKINLRRERDAAAEERQEKAALKLKSQQKRRAEKDKKKFKLEKPKSNPFMDWAEKTFAPLRDFFLGVAAVGVITKYNSIRNNSEDQEKWEDFWFKTKFVFEKIWNFANGSFKSIIEGWGKLFGKEKQFGERVEGLGEIVKGVAGLAVIGFFLNPMALVNLVLGGIDWMLNWQPPGADGADLPGRKGKTPTKTPSTTTVKPPTKKLSPFELEQQRKALTRSRSLAKPTSGLSPKLAPKGAIFGRGVDRATQRIMLRIIGKGGVKWLTKTFNKIPLIGPLLTFGFNWAAGEPFLKAAVQGVGMGLGQWLGGMAGSAIGGLGGPAAPITIPLGGFIGAMLGGIGGEFLGGYLYDLFAGKANLGKDLKALGGKIMGALDKLWNEYIMNGDFWAGAWQTFLNVGGKIMTDAWQAVVSLWNFATSKATDFGKLIWEASAKFRESMWKAFQKYILTPFADLPNLAMQLANVIAEKAVAAWVKSGDFINKLKDKFIEALQKELNLDFVTEVAKIVVDPRLWNPIDKLKAIADLILPVIGPTVKYAMQQLDTFGKAAAKALMKPLNEYIDPAVKAVTNGWNLLTNLGGWVYDNGIKPVFDAVTSVWTSGPAIWEWLNRPNTFQELTGQDVPVERAGGGKVALYAGHADMKTDGSAGTQYGTDGGGIKYVAGKAQATAPRQSYAQGYQSNEAYFNDKIAQKAAAKSGGIAIYRRPIRVGPSIDSKSNWSRIDRDNAKGITTIEIHQDAPRPLGMSGMIAAQPDARTRGRHNGFLKAMNSAYGIHNRQDIFGPINRNNLSGLVEIGPLEWPALRNSSAFIEKHSSKIANALKAGARGNVPEVTGDPDDDGGGADDAGEYSDEGDTGSVSSTPSEPPPPANPMDALEGLQKGLFDAFGMGEKLAAADAQEEKLATADVFKMVAEGKLDGLSSIVDLSKFKFSQEYAMQNDAANMIPFPVAFQMPVPIAIQNTINTGGDQVVNVRTSPFVDK